MEYTLTCGCKITIADVDQTMGGITGVAQSYTQYCDGHRPPRPDAGSEVNINIKFTFPFTGSVNA